MQYLVVIVCACAVIALVAGNVVDKQITSNNVSDEQVRSCPKRFENELDPLTTSDMMDMALACGSDPKASQRFQNFTSVDEFRRYFHHYCQEAPAKRHCLSEVLATSQRCFNQPQQKVHQMMVGMCETVLNIGCADDGELLAKFFHAYVAPDSLEYYIVQCLTTVGLKFKRDTDKNLVLERPGNDLIFYRKLDDLKECLMPDVEDNEDLKATIVTIFDGIRQDLKCIDPELHILVLCSGIDKN